MSHAQPSVDVNTPLAGSEYDLRGEEFKMLSANQLLGNLRVSVYSQDMVLLKRILPRSLNASRNMRLQGAKVGMIKQEMTPSDRRGEGGNSWAASAIRDSG